MTTRALMNPAFTAADIPDQSGRTIVITGANNGLGQIAALALARAGARVVLACRNQTTGRAALERVTAAGPGADHELVALDLASLASVRTAAEQILGAHAEIDVLINNAGIMAVPFGTTVDGFENQIGTNHFGHFAFTDALFPALSAADAPRVVTLSSIAHRDGVIDLTDINFELRPYQRMTAYAQSKLANLLFGSELARRTAAAGSPVMSVIAHPGVSATNLFDSMVPRIPGALTVAHAALRIVGNSEAQGASSQLYAATMSDVVNGDYLGPNRLNGIRGPVARSPRADQAKDVEMAAALWEMSSRLTGAHFEALR